MLDRLASRSSPLAGLAFGRIASVTISDPRPMSRLVLRGSDVVAKQAGLALGLPLSLEAGRSATREGRVALWLGADEWLLLAPLEQGGPITEKLAAALASAPHALIDVSHRNTALVVEGLGAAAALNAGCPLDLDPTAFPVRAATRTLLRKAEIMLWRKGAHRFHIEVWRSFAAYTHRFVLEASRNLTPGRAKPS